MGMSDINFSVLRDKIASNTQAMRELSKQLELSNLLKLLDLGLISKDEIFNNETYKIIKQQDIITKYIKL